MRERSMWLILLIGLSACSARPCRKIMQVSGAGAVLVGSAVALPEALDHRRGKKLDTSLLAIAAGAVAYGSSFLVCPLPEKEFVPFYGGWSVGQ